MFIMLRAFSLVLAMLLLAVGPASADLLATYSSRGGESAEHLVPRPSVATEVGATSTPFLKSGPFTVVWRGQLQVPKRLRLYFSFVGEGEASLKVDGEVLHAESGIFGAAKSERLRLNEGAYPVEITYTSKEDGSGSFRLFWEERSFAPEPIPSSAWLAPEGAVAPLVDHGRTAFAQQRCVMCHLPEQDFGPAAMPELSAAGPDLTGIGSRVSEEWLTRWIAQPDKLKPTTTMPAMVNHRTAKGAKEAADLGAYLFSLKAPKVGEEFAVKPTLAEAGGAHFHQLGCVACHTLPGVDVPDLENERIPLNNLATKFQGGALTAFLKNPRAHNPWIKMPHFGFSDQEAQALSAFLTKESTGCHTPDPSEFPPGDAELGKLLAESLNCAACHQGFPTAASSSAPKLGEILKLKDWSTRGCLAEEEKRGKAPRLMVEAESKAAINLFAHQHLESLSRTTPSYYALRQVEALNCRACHADNGVSARLATLHPDSLKFVAHLEGEKIDQSRPQLTYMGEMLNTSYVEKMLQGTVSPRARPWLEMRMPSFSQHATLLAQGLSELHGLAPSQPDDTPRNAEAAAIGKELVGLEGLACITCHGIEDLKPLAAFEVMGINFAHVHNRLQPDFFYRWLRNPHRITSDSRMPRYTTEEGEGLRQDILEGDAQKQFEAIWEYLKEGPKMEKP